MKAEKTRQLKRAFEAKFGKQIEATNDEDKRKLSEYKYAWRRFKKIYNKIPRDMRDGYV